MTNTTTRQSPRQAVDRLMRGQAADFVPLQDAPWGDTLDAWLTQGYPTTHDGRPVDPAQHFGFDMVGVGGWFEWQARRGANEVLQETDEWRIVRNGNGAALKWWKHRSGTPEHIDFHMRSPQIWQRHYRPLLVDFDPSRVDTTAAAANLAHWRARDRWCSYGHQFIWEILRASLGDVDMLMALVEQPAWIHDICRVYTDFYKQAYAHLIDTAGKPDGIWVYEDLGYRDKLFCSPSTLRDLIFPYYTELVDFFHGYDLPVILHSCGFQEPMIPLAIDAGFDALNPMEVKAGNDIMAYAERHGHDLAFIGGFDAIILESGDRPRIRAAVTAHMEGLKARGARFVFGSDHSLSTNVAYEDFAYAVEVYRELSAY